MNDKRAKHFNCRDERIMRALADLGFEIAPGRFTVDILGREVIVETIFDFGLPHMIRAVHRDITNGKGESE